MRVQAPTTTALPPRAPDDLAPPTLGNAPPVRDSMASMARPVARPPATSFHWDSVLSVLSSVQQTLTHLWKLSLDTAQVIFDNIVSFFTKLTKGTPQPAADPTIPLPRAPQAPAAVPAPQHLAAFTAPVATRPLPEPAPASLMAVAHPPAADVHPVVVHHAPVAVVVEATPPTNAFASLAAPSVADKESIDTIIHGTATTSVAWLVLSGKAVEFRAKGEVIARNVHPLQFLAYIFRQPEADRPNLSEDMHRIYSDSITWSSFMHGTLLTTGLATQLSAANQTSNLVPYLEGFAAAVNKTSSLPELTTHSTAGDWEAFVKTLVLATGSGAPSAPADAEPVIQHVSNAAPAPTSAPIVAAPPPAMTVAAPAAHEAPAAALLVESTVAAATEAPLPAPAAQHLAAAAPAATVTVPPRAELRTLTQLTETQKTTLRGIVDKLAGVGFWDAARLLGSANQIVNQWKSLGFTHPLLLLEFLLTDTWDKFATVSNNLAVYPAFYGSLSEQLVKQPSQPLPHPLSDYVDEFTTKMRIAAGTPTDSVLRQTIENPSIKQWLLAINALVNHRKATPASR